MKSLKIVSAVVFGAIFAHSAMAQTESIDKMKAKSPITIQDIWKSGAIYPQRIGSLRSMNDGEHYTAMSPMAITQYSFRTGEKVRDLCVFGGPAQAKKAKPLPHFQSYEMSNDEQKILLSANFEPIYRHSGVADYYIYDRSNSTFTCISLDGKQRLTTFSPDGTKVAFVRDNNLYCMDLDSQVEFAITTDGKLNSVINGTTDWVYEEEFGITQGFAWSPDSKKIAFYRFDESGVRQYSMQMWGELYPEDYNYKYPKAGEDNSRVDIFIFDLEKMVTMRPNLGSENDQYLPRFQWTNDANTLAVMRMNRLQNHMELLLVDAATAKVSPLYEEKSDTYVEVPDTWMFLEDGKHFLLTNEQDGYNHIYMYDLQGRLVRQITSGAFDVSKVCAVDEKNKKIYFTSHESSAINTDLYVIGFDGKKKTSLNDNGVAGTYGAVFSKGCKYYVRSWSDANHPLVYTLFDSKGKQVKVLESNGKLQQWMDEKRVGRKQFGMLPGADGTMLNYFVILPPNFDSTKQYPLFFEVYGGPGHQEVVNSYGYADYFWQHMLADYGYVVVSIDGRGTGGRGAEFKKSTYRNLGKLECEDVIAAARWFGQKNWIDQNRIGIFGWSFGGYLSSLAILKGNDVFKSAIAVAPVITWRYYDNIYTERFLQRPQDNAAGYDDNSPLTYADQLKGNYLLVHGTGDDNVHVQNAMDMISALENANKQFEMRVYPNKNHNINGGCARENLYVLMTDFLLRKL